MEIFDEKEGKKRARMLPGKLRELFIENFYLMLSADIPADEALESILDASRDGRFIKAVQKARHLLDEGIPLWRSLSLAGLVSDETNALLFIGEKSGKLAEKVGRARDIEHHQQMQARQIKSAFSYPIFIVLLTVSIGLGIAWFLLPRLATTFTQLNVSLPFITRYMLNAGQFLQHHGKVFVPVTLVGLFLCVSIVFKFKSFRRILFRILTHTPGIGRLLLELEIARMGQLLSSLLAVGMPANNAFLLLRRSTDEPRFRAMYLAFADSLSLGESIGSFLLDKKQPHSMLPAAVKQLLIAGEKSGKLVGTLRRIGKNYEEKALSSSNGLEKMVEPVLLVVVWVGVMILALGIFLPIYKLIGGLSQ